MVNFKIIIGLLLVGVLILSGCGGTVNPPKETHFSVGEWIEAEEGTPSGSMKLSSNNDYVYSDVENEGYVSFIFKIEEKGDYILDTYARGGFGGDRSDSFFVGTGKEPARNNNFYSWDMHKSDEFINDQVSRRNAEDYTENDKLIDPMVWTLNPGLHEFFFYGREANTHLDKIKLTKMDKPYVPPEKQPTCTDKKQNGNEEGIDCGGTYCPPCSVTPTCSDNKKNGNEEGVDCGGNCPACPEGIPLFEPYEKEFTTLENYDNPYYRINEADVILTTPSGVKKTVPMFWDGDDTWKLRYSPMEEGTHTYTTKSSDSGLNGKAGSFNAVDMGNRGFLEIDKNNPLYFKYSEESEPVLMMGDTFWNSFSTAGDLDYETFKKYVDIRAAQGVNYLRIYVVAMYYPAYNYNVQPINSKQHRNEGGIAFFDWDRDKLNPGYFQGVEKRIAYANSKGMMVNLVVTSDRDNPTKFFGWDDDGKRMERYLKHLAARLDAYDINWEGRTEFEEQDSFTTDPTGMEVAKLIGESIEKYGVHDHVQSMHTLDSNIELVNEPWFDWIMHQGHPGTGGQDGANDGIVYQWTRVTKERTHGKPVMNEEYYYEHEDADPSTHGHHRIANEIRKGAWQLMMHGSAGTAYGNTGTYNARSREFDSLDYARSEGAGYMTQLVTFFDLVDFWNYEPKPMICSSGYCLVNPGNGYVAYSESGSSFNIKVGSGTYEAKFYNPRTGDFEKTIIVEGCGIRTFTKPDNNDWVVWLKAISSTPTCGGEPSSGETIVIQDDLKGSTKKGTKYGGTFTSEGYKPGKGENNVLYTVPKQIWNGYVEVEVKGFDFNQFPSGESNSNPFYVFYDGRGTSGPVSYSNYRANYYRWETVYRSSRVISGKEYGDVFKGKMMIASPETSNSLPSGKQAVFPLYPDEPDKSYAIADWKNEPSGVYASWDPNKWYTVRTEWNNDDFTYKIFRDEGNGFVEVWDMRKNRGNPYEGHTSGRDVFYPSTPDIPYLPTDFKIRLGSGVGDKYDNEMSNIMYRNFKVVEIN